MNTKIVKASGEKEVFSERKFKRSLKRSGVDDKTIADVTSEIMFSLKEGKTTKEIYKQAFDLLKRYSKSHAARYKLKQAINNFGPSGFPFELFVAELLKQEGYITKTGVIADGHCVKHEIDVIAEKDEDHFMVECKFHNSQNIHCDVKIPLYIQARFDDVATKWKELPEHRNKFHQAWLVTNTRFTTDAIAYGRCMDINLVSWDYPEKLSLRERISSSGLYPITCLISLTAYEKSLILAKRVVLCKQLCKAPDILREIGIRNTERIKDILHEAEDLCSSRSII